jgi:hypothetical protein
METEESVVFTTGIMEDILLDQWRWLFGSDFPEVIVFYIDALYQEGLWKQNK